MKTIRIFSFDIPVGRKLRKLFRNPKKFFRDMKMLRFLNLNKGDFGVSAINDSYIQDGLDQLSPRVSSSNPDLECFELRGDNWNDEDGKKIAVLWGFNEWKHGFVAKYLNDYRVAFPKSQIPWGKVKKSLERIDDYVFICWGKNENKEIELYSSQKSIPLFRMEDGFIRSTDLGSKHTLPLSLALDKKGIYYDATCPSELENILNEYDFTKDPSLVSSARKLIEVYKALGISKYSLPTVRTASEVLGQKLKKRVLVIGQVDQDASIKYGLASNYSSSDLLDLAIRENPQAEILYRPHPDVTAGYRKNSILLEELKEKCTVVDQNVSLASIFSVVDHVYVITSLSGFEALLHNVPVTVLGAPFYSGWGLTHDHVIVTRRHRKLKLEELFCAAYLLYPRYLSGNGDPVVGCLSAMLTISAQRRNVVDRRYLGSLDSTKIKILKTSGFWPVLFREKNLEKIENNEKNITSCLNIATYFQQYAGIHFERFLVYYLAGSFLGKGYFNSFLNKIRDQVSIFVYMELIDNLLSIKPSDHLLGELIWCKSKIPDLKSNVKEHAEDVIFAKLNIQDISGSRPFPKKRYVLTLKLAQDELSEKNYEKAEKLFLSLLLYGYFNVSVVKGLADIARLRFDFSSATAILDLFAKYDPAWYEREGAFILSQYAALARNDALVIESFASACIANPSQLARYIGDSIADVPYFLRGLPYTKAALEAILCCSGGTVISRSEALISMNRSDEAEALLTAYTPSKSEVERYSYVLVNVWRMLQKFQNAKELARNLIMMSPSEKNYSEALRVAIESSDYDWGNELLKLAEGRGLEVGEIYHRKVGKGNTDFKKIFLSHRLMKSSRLLTRYFGEKYVQSIEEINSSAATSCLIIAYFGPGDEIRFASLYPQMKVACKTENVKFTCDPRLYKLLQRSFIDLKFYPVERIRSLTWLESYQNFDKLPGSDLFRHLDNAGLELVEKSDKIILQLDALADVVEDRDSFKGEAFLNIDTGKVAAWRKRLEAYHGETLVGLCWRSSLNTPVRSSGYLLEEALGPLFDQTDAKFICLQYGDYAEELEVINQLYPGRLVNFSDLDTFNDLDGMAALMNCLDVVIAPATTVAELAGAIGCKTLMFSSSSQNNWRMVNGGSSDLWHNSLRHVNEQDKAKLPFEIASKLNEMLNENSNALRRASNKKYGS